VQKGDYPIIGNRLKGRGFRSKWGKRKKWPQGKARFRKEKRPEREGHHTLSTISKWIEQGRKEEGHRYQKRGKKNRQFRFEVRIPDGEEET